MTTAPKASGKARNNNAGTKAPSKAERLRNNLTKANASAAKKLPGVTDFGKLALDLVSAASHADGASRIMAHFMNNEFGQEMAELKVHWSALTSSNAKNASNLQSIFNRIEERRKAVQELALAKGLANINKPWGDMKRIALELHRGGKANERDGKSLDDRQKTDLTRLYKACMADELATERQCEVNRLIGEILMAHFKVDLSAINTKK
jgi:hypothetical protein